MSNLILAYDIGTASLKTALFDDKLNLIENSSASYEIKYPQDGWAEQNPLDYWKAIKKTTGDILKRDKNYRSSIMGLSFACQMNCTIPVDRNGKPLMNTISWLDTRASEVTKAFSKGFFKVSGYPLAKIIRFLRITGGGPGFNGKDPISHILWIKKHRPQIYKQTYKFLSVKDFVIQKCTNNFVISRDLAHTSWLMDTRKGKFEWSQSILEKYGIDGNKLPEIKKLTEHVGTLTKNAAKTLGLNKEIPIISGGGDLVSTAIGAGSIENNQFALCLGTAAWIATHTDKRKLDLKHYIGPICAYGSKYLCISKQETGATCLDWAKNNLFKEKILQLKEEGTNIYQYLDSLIKDSPPGANEIIFTPWMFGERSPVNNPNIRAGFHNLSLNHKRVDLLRAIYEGVGYNLLWSLKELQNLAGETDSIRIIGGGAKSNIWCQIIADILNKSIFQLKNPELAGVKGAAIIGLVGLDLLESFSDAIPFLPIKKQYYPNPAHQNIYSKLFKAFLSFYEKNEDIFQFLHSS